MTISISLQLLIALGTLIAGILIFIYPRLLARIVAIYLIATGALGLMAHLNVAT